MMARIAVRDDVASVDTADRHDRGYYEIEYFLNNGARVEIAIDPQKGAAVKA